MHNLNSNKFFAGILISLIVLKMGDFVSGYFMETEKLEKKAYVIDTSTLDSGKGDSSDLQEKDAPDIMPFLKKASLENGEKVFKKCLQCHTTNKDGINKVGPNLWGVVSNTYAHRQDFAYSQVLKAEHEKKKWTFDNLNQFLFKPKKHLPGTKMSFVGIKDDQERADVIFYLRSQSDNAVPIE